jgi:hypothetical protein
MEEAYPFREEAGVRLHNSNDAVYGWFGSSHKNGRVQKGAFTRLCP